MYATRSQIAHAAHSFSSDLPSLSNDSIRAVCFGSAACVHVHLLCS